MVHMQLRIVKMPNIKVEKYKKLNKKQYNLKKY